MSLWGTVLHVRQLGPTICTSLPRLEWPGPVASRRGHLVCVRERPVVCILGHTKIYEHERGADRRIMGTCDAQHGY